MAVKGSAPEAGGVSGGDAGAARACGSPNAYLVSPTGSDSNDGSCANPWATIQHAARRRQSRGHDKWQATLDGLSNATAGGFGSKAATSRFRTFRFKSFGNGNSGGGSAIQNDNGGTDLTIVRNNIHDIGRMWTGHSLTLENNLATASSMYDATTSGVTDNSNYLGTDPLFVSASTDDSHLLQGSPAIDHGTSTSDPSWDFDGVSRPQGAGYDIGTCEWH